MLYLAMSGAKQTMLAQAANANNLANASTTGFREDLLAYSSHELTGAGHPTRVYSVAGQGGVNHNSGAIITTGHDLDVSINGDGWIAVQSPDGSEAYTRAGNLRLTPNGVLVTGAGHPVLGDGGGPVAIPPAEKIEIGGDGTISIRPVGQTPETLAVVDRIRLVNPGPGELVKGQDGLMHMRSGLGAAPDAAVQLSTGTLEGSNVNTIDAMVNMISLSRQFEMQIKMMKTAEENDQASAQMMRIT